MFQTLLVPGHSNKKSSGRRLTKIFKARLDAAAWLAKEFGATIVIVSGKGPHKTTEADLGGDYLERQRRVPSFTIVLREKVSKETIGNYIFSTAAFIKPLRIGRVVTVTSPEQANRCHQIARHLWGAEVNHAVFTAIPKTRKRKTNIQSVTKALESDQLKDLKNDDFIADFIASGAPGFQYLPKHLRWLRVNYAAQTAKKYPTVARVSSASKSGPLTEHGWATIVRLLDNRHSQLTKWWNNYKRQAPMRRQMYRAVALNDRRIKGGKLRPGLRRAVLLSIAELGRLAEKTSPAVNEGQIGLILHQVPIKFYHCFVEYKDFERVRPIDARRFKVVMRACLKHVLQSDRPIRVWVGQGRYYKKHRTFRGRELKALLSRIDRELLEPHSRLIRGVA